MTCLKAKHLEIGDRVVFSGCNIRASGTIIEALGPEYVRVQWSDCRLATTHRRHALQFRRFAELREWPAIILGTATPPGPAPIAQLR